MWYLPDGLGMCGLIFSAHIQPASEDIRFNVTSSTEPHCVSTSNCAAITQQFWIDMESSALLKDTSWHLCPLVNDLTGLISDFSDVNIMKLIVMPTNLQHKCSHRDLFAERHQTEVLLRWLELTQSHSTDHYQGLGSNLNTVTGYFNLHPQTPPIAEI